MTERKMAPILLLLLLACASFAQTAQPTQPQPGASENIISSIFSGIIENWIGKTTFNVLAGSIDMCAPKTEYGNIYLALVQLSITAVLVSLFLSVVLYFFGKMMYKDTSNVQPSSFLTLKITDSLVSIIVIILIALAYFQSGGPDYVPLLNGMKYVSTVISLTVNSYFFMMVMNWMMHFVMNVSIPLDIMSQLGTRMMGLGLDKILSPVSTLITILSTYSNLVVGEFMTKLGLLCFVRSSMFYVLLPLGFFLRGFSMSKGAGNSIIALCIALHFFYPIMLTMNYAIFNVDMALDANTLSSVMFNSAVSYLKFATLPLMVKAAVGGTAVVAQPLANSGLPSWLSSRIPAGVTSWFGKASGGFVNLVGVMSKFSSFWVLAYVTLISVGIFQGTYGIIFFLAKVIAVYGLVLTAIDIFATLTFARELSGILGTPIELSAFMKIL
jgi:hypothetical protein